MQASKTTKGLSERPLETVQLPDLRRLAYVRFGSSDGFPVFYFHGTPSSRLEGAFADAAAKHHDLTLIAIDRPGFGQSSFQPGRRFLDWPADVLALADHLGINRFGVAGHSGAGPHLFACGVRIDPARLAFIGALAPWGPVASVDIGQSLSRVDRLFLRAARERPWLVHTAFAPMGWVARFWPDLFLWVLGQSVAPPDRKALQIAALRAAFGAALSEAFRQGSRGAAFEASLAYAEWGFDLASICVPTHTWLGEVDIFVPTSMGRYIETQIPGVDFHWVAGAGHLNVENWDDIFAACRESI